MVQIIGKSMPKFQARREAEWICQELPKTQWINASNQRARQVPLQYILGNQPFGRLDLKCKRGVLIPRLDTEEWVLEVADLLKNVKINNIVDYCTGSGCIGLSLASELKFVTQLACIDFKKEAVELSSENYQRNKDKIHVPVTIHQGDLFKSYLPTTCKVSDSGSNFLVSNPPYIPSKDLIFPEVEPSVLKYEPQEALLGDLEFYEALCENILIPNNSFKGFIFELGYLKQAALVKSLLDSNWVVGTRTDLSGNLRNVLGFKKNSEFNVLESMIHTII